MLARPAANGGGADLEWYPVGRLVLWAAVIGALIVVAAVPNFGTDLASLQANLRKTYERILRDKSAIDLLVAVVPAAAAVFSTITNTLNLWLAARIVKFSGRLRRPWPDLSALRLPAATSGLLALAIAGSFLPDLLGVFSGVLRREPADGLCHPRLCRPACGHPRDRQPRHSCSRAPMWRPSFGWPLLVIAVLGLADTVFDIRGRVTKRGPPSLPT